MFSSGEYGENNIHDNASNSPFHYHVPHLLLGALQADAPEIPFSFFSNPVIIRLSVNGVRCTKKIKPGQCISLPGLLGDVLMWFAQRRKLCIPEARSNFRIYSYFGVNTI